RNHSNSFFFFGPNSIQPGSSTAPGLITMTSSSLYKTSVTISLSIESLPPFAFGPHGKLVHHHRGYLLCTLSHNNATASMTLQFKHTTTTYHHRSLLTA